MNISEDTRDLVDRYKMIEVDIYDSSCIIFLFLNDTQAIRSKYMFVQILMTRFGLFV